MQNIITACDPREDILGGTFNPEIFTASLNEVIQYYQTNQHGIHPIYTDAVQFFTEGTYATDGFKMVLNEVFARLAGDGTAPAIHRLETAFGGGKTHTLIACTHIGNMGDEISDCIGGLVESRYVPRKGDVHVVGISGIDIPVHKPRGTRLIPYTLWGEIAFQIGGEKLYKEVAEEATSKAAPGGHYFETVFENRCVLLMIDELAQYAARLSAVGSGEEDQLAAFLLKLHDYARSRTGVSVVLTLASTNDAFGRQTAQLTELLSRITGRDVDTDDALTIGEKAVESIASVVARDATSVVPVQASEISRVLSKRLFVRIDETAAKETAGRYREMYQKNSELLPDKACRENFFGSLVAHYPFHPSFIDFLNHKLSTYENFQGTRGVLRVLATAVRALWRSKPAIPMIHTCHLDLRDARIVNEVVGRTGSGDLLTVLNADVGGADTDSLTGGSSNAEEADRRNPHPEGYPLYEYTWKTIFLHSLVGRNQGLKSGIFGLTEPDALFDVSFPGLTPPQVITALKEVKDSAFYLRFEQGRYYASLDPSVNIALARLRRGLQAEAVDGLLEATARKVVGADVGPFHIIPDVTAPEHIADKKGKPSLALISLKADPIDVEAFITTAGPSRPRIEQNLVFLLVPQTVQVKTGKPEQQLLEQETAPGRDTGRSRLNDLTRSVLAMRELKKNPENYGIPPQKLEKDDFVQRHTERENALISMVTESYRSLWYPSAGGRIVCKEIRTAGGESGTAVMEQIKKALLEDNELITTTPTTKADLKKLAALFFSQQDIVNVSTLRENFCRIRKWPILESPDVLPQIIRAGVNAGNWCLFRMGKEDTPLPDEFFSCETGELPFTIDVEQEGYSLVTPEGARQRGWEKPSKPDIHRLQDQVWEATRQSGIETVADISENVSVMFGDVPETETRHTILKLIRQNKVYAYKGTPDQQEKPELIKGTDDPFYVPEDDDVVVTPAKAAEKGWIDEEEKTIRLSGKEGAEKIMPLLHRIGSIYAKGGKSRIDMLDITDMELPEGGVLRIAVENAEPETLKNLGELFETVAGVVVSGGQTGCHLTVSHPEKDCPFIQEIEKDDGRERK